MKTWCLRYQQRNLPRFLTKLILSRHFKRRTKSIRNPCVMSQLNEVKSDSNSGWKGIKSPVMIILGLVSLTQLIWRSHTSWRTKKSSILTPRSESHIKSKQAISQRISLLQDSMRLQFKCNSLCFSYLLCHHRLI